MITSLEINQYIDSCVNNFASNFGPTKEEKDEFDFLIFRYSPTFLYFETKYGNIMVSKKIASELMNMNELYKIKCDRFILKLNAK